LASTSQRCDPGGGYRKVVHTCLICMLIVGRAWSTKVCTCVCMDRGEVPVSFNFPVCSGVSRCWMRRPVFCRCGDHHRSYLCGRRLGLCEWVGHSPRLVDNSFHLLLCLRDLKADGGNAAVTLLLPSPAGIHHSLQTHSLKPADGGTGMVPRGGGHTGEHATHTNVGDKTSLAHAEDDPGGTRGLEEGLKRGWGKGGLATFDLFWNSEETETETLSLIGSPLCGTLCSPPLSCSPAIPASRAHSPPACILHKSKLLPKTLRVCHIHSNNSLTTSPPTAQIRDFCVKRILTTCKRIKRLG